MSGWSFAYEGFEPADEGLREALCTLGNGYFGTRGAASEAVADDVHYPGTYAGGVFNRLSDEISGRTIENESVPNLPNWLPLSFRPEGGDWLDLQAVAVEAYRQELDLRRGVLTRNLRVRDIAGRTTTVVERRFVSMASMHLAAQEWTLVPENWSGTVHVRAAIDGRVRNSGVKRYSALSSRHLRTTHQARVDDETVVLEAETVQSHVRVAVAARTRLLREGEAAAYTHQHLDEDDYTGFEYEVEVTAGEPLTVEKVASLYLSRDPAISEPCLAAKTAVSRAGGFAELLERHVLAWEHLWQRFDLDVDGDGETNVVLRLHIFHLLQTVSRNSIGLDVGVPPRGLHGEAYRGHIFWDELFIFQVTDLRMPELTRSLLLYRYRRLGEARWAAREASYAGAMFPWQSGSNGREESQQVHLNPRSGRWLPDYSHIQRHVGIAIAYSTWHYYQVTGDAAFMSTYGAELILEIARFFASLAEYNHARDRYDIRGVMGPDEYHDAYPDGDRPGLDNNAYTNVMAAWVLRRAQEALEVVSAECSSELRETLRLSAEELSRWDDIARKLYVPFHGNGIISQFEGYDDLEEFDWAGYRERYGNIQRLDRILEAEGDTPNRYKLSKQADVLMLFFLLSADELRDVLDGMGYELPPEAIPRNVDYYLQRTSHGSTLSHTIHSWVLARTNRQRSYELFKQALRSDIADSQNGTTKEGIHLGAMAGTIDIVQRCYTGIEVHDDTLWLNPTLPEDFAELVFPIRYRGHNVTLRVNHRLVRVSTAPCDAPPMQVGFRDEVVRIGPGETREFAITRQE